MTRWTSKDVAKLDPSSAVVPVTSIRGHGSQRGGPSKVEQRYRRHLDLLVSLGSVVSYVAQPPAIVLPAYRCTYTPDFEVQLVDVAAPFKAGLRNGSVTHTAHPWSCVCGCRHPGPSEVVEVKDQRKGRPWFRDPEAWLKCKLAARVLSQRDPPVPLVVVWPCGSGWARETVHP